MVTIIKLCITGFLICGFAYSCNSSAKAQKTETPHSNNTPGTQVSKQKSNNTQAKQVSEQRNPKSPKKAKKEISKNWKTFFSGETNAQVRMHLLQHGKQYTKVLKKFSQSNMAQKASASITGIKLNNDTTATVSYIINIGGAPVLKDKTGKAFYLNGTWKVSDTAFCSLLELSGNTPAPCPGSNSGSSKSPNQI